MPSIYKKPRAAGAEQPHISIGKSGLIKLRIPFYHYRFAWPEACQGVLLVAVALAAIPMLEQVLEVPFDIAVMMVVFFSMLYIIHPTIGDCMFPGWVTPAIPLLIAHHMQWGNVTDRIHSVIAFQMMVAAMFIVLGVTRFSGKIIKYVPMSIRTGILLGAAVSAAMSIFNTHMPGREISAVVGMSLTLIALYSVPFFRAKARNNFLQAVGKYGMVPGLFGALVVGVLVGEMEMPVIEWGVSPLPVAELISGWTIFGVGFPPLHHFIGGVPLLVAVYIIAFGDFVLCRSLVDENNAHFRKDEFIDYNPDRSSVASGLRNLLLSLFAPYVPLAGPLWASGSIAPYERHKLGRREMDSIHDGISSFLVAMGFAGLLLPLVTLLRPALPIGLIITFAVQAFACGYIALNMAQTKEERGCAALVAFAISFHGAAVGLIVGVFLHLVIGVPKPAAIEAEAVLAAEAAATMEDS